MRFVIENHLFVIWQRDIDKSDLKFAFLEFSFCLTFKMLNIKSNIKYISELKSVLMALMVCLIISEQRHCPMTGC